MSRDKLILYLGAAAALPALVVAVAYRSAFANHPSGIPLLLLVFGGAIGLIAYGTLRSRVRDLEAAQTSSSKNLRDSEVRFEQLFDSSPIPALVTGIADGKVLAANESAAVQFHVRREDAGAFLAGFPR